jgi:hypothetical protein
MVVVIVPSAAGLSVVACFTTDPGRLSVIVLYPGRG